MPLARVSPMNDFSAEPSRASQSLAFYRILFTAGFSLLCFLGADLLTLLANLRLRDPNSELALVLGLQDRLPVLLVGLALLLCGARRLTIKLEHFILLWTSRSCFLFMGLVVLSLVMGITATERLRTMGLNRLSLAAEARQKQEDKGLEMVEKATPEQLAVIIERLNRGPFKEKPVTVEDVIPRLKEDATAKRMAVTEAENQQRSSGVRAASLQIFRMVLTTAIAVVALWFLWKQSDWIRSPEHPAARRRGSAR